MVKKWQKTLHFEKKHLHLQCQSRIKWHYKIDETNFYILLLLFLL